jgi:DNA helicase II / ATP-dependent DNA helicase PcrA
VGTVEADALLEGLTARQRAAVTSTAQPLCVLAGAGSGKTRVLTRRVAYRAATASADPRHALVLTFTRKAAGELRHRLAELGVGAPVAAGTFHAVALSQLRQRWADRGVRPPAIVDDKARLIGPLVAAAVRSAPPRLVAGFTSEIEWAKAQAVTPDQFVTAAAVANRHPPAPPAVVAGVFAAYEAHKHKRGLIDLDDLVPACAEAIETDGAFATRQRWRWRHLFVDEYQDVNPAHARLLQAWMGVNADLCVVGDPNQAIYGWNGADPSLLTTFTDSHPTAEVVALGDNFRSTPEILLVAGAVLAQAAGAADPEAGRASGLAPTVTAYDTAAEEAAGVARAIRDRHYPASAWSSLAVLARTNAQLALIADALAASGIPHRIRGGRPLAGLPVVRDLLSPANGSLAASEPTLAPGGRRASQPSAAAGTRPVSALAADARQLLAERPADASDTVLRSLLDAVAEYLDLDPSGTTDMFAAWLAAAELTYDGASGDAVVLSTFHRAKGLEWPVVFLVGLESGLVPLTRAAGSPPLAEERRLLYVAMTRAEVELRCSWARQRRFGEQDMARSPSPFLDDVQGALARLARPRRPADSVEALRHARRSLIEADRPAAGLLDDLRAWRDGVARAGRVSPSAVLADRTLLALATRRPETPADLGAIPGLGQVSATRWGPALLAVVARHPPPG